MYRKCNSHAWCKVKTTSIKYNFSLGFHSSRCLGHFQCQNDCFVEFVFLCLWNEIIWVSNSTQVHIASHFAPSPHACTLVYKFCFRVHFCINVCKCIIYYVIHKLVTFMRATIHLKKHDHPIQDDMCKESLEEIKALVKEKVYHTLNSKHSSIGLFASKPLSQHLFNEDGGNLVNF